MEHGLALGGRVALGQTLEGVEQHIVGVRHLVRREVALEHTPLRAELLDTVVHKWRQTLGQRFRADGSVPLMPVETVARLSDAAQFEDDIGPRRRDRYARQAVLRRPDCRKAPPASDLRCGSRLW